jgi:hypothetical protein
MTNLERRLKALDRMIPLPPCDHEWLPLIYHGKNEYEAAKERREKIRANCPRCSKGEDLVIILQLGDKPEENTRW